MPGISTIAERIKGKYVISEENRNLLIKDDKANLREDYGDLSEVKASILRHGIRPNLLISMSEDGTFAILKDGYRRVTAYDELIQEGKSELIPNRGFPIEVDEESATEEGAIWLALETSTGKPLTIFERGKGFKKLQELGQTLEEIALRKGITSMAVHNAIKSFEMPDDIKKFVENGEISATEAVAVVKNNKGDSGKALETIVKAKELATEEAIEKGKEKVKITGRHTEQAKVFAANPEIFDKPDPTETIAEDMERQTFIMTIQRADLEDGILWDKVTTKALETFYKALI